MNDSKFWDSLGNIEDLDTFFEAREENEVIPHADAFASVSDSPLFASESELEARSEVKSNDSIVTASPALDPPVGLQRCGSQETVSSTTAETKEEAHERQKQQHQQGCALVVDVMQLLLKMNETGGKTVPAQAKRGLRSVDSVPGESPSKRALIKDVSKRSSVKRQPKNEYDEDGLPLLEVRCISHRASEKAVDELKRNPAYRGWNDSKQHKSIIDTRRLRTEFCAMDSASDNDLKLLMQQLLRSEWAFVMSNYDTRVNGGKRLSALYSSIPDEDQLLKRTELRNSMMPDFFKSRRNRHHWYMHVVRCIIRSEVGVVGLKRMLEISRDNLMRRRADELFYQQQEEEAAAAIGYRKTRASTSSSAVAAFHHEIGADEVFFEMLRTDKDIALIALRVMHQLYFTPPTFTDMHVYCGDPQCGKSTVCPVFCIGCRKMNVHISSDHHRVEFQDLNAEVKTLCDYFIDLESMCNKLGSTRNILAPSTTAFLFIRASVYVGCHELRQLCHSFASQLHLFNYAKGLGVPAGLQKKNVSTLSETILKSFVEYVLAQRAIDDNRATEYGNGLAFSIQDVRMQLIGIPMERMVGYEPGPVDNMSLPVCHKRYCPTCGVMKNRVVKTELSRLTSDKLPEFVESTIDLPVERSVYLKCTAPLDREPEYKCSRCRQPLVKQYWFRDLTELLVWAALFDEAGVPLPDRSTVSPQLTAIAVAYQSHIPAIFNRQVFDSCKYYTTKAVAEMVRRVRPYQTKQVLGKFNYCQQCYFVTHLVLVASKYGTLRIVHPESFVEEIVFMSNAMEQAIYDDDVELVGEFCFCLKLLGAEPSNNMALFCGMLYLKKTLHQLQDTVVWKSNANDLEKRAHVLWCLISGLMPLAINLPEYDSDVWKGF